MSRNHIMKRKIFILSAAIAVVTVWSLFFAVQPAYATESVQYIEKSWNADSKQVVSTTKTAECTPITSDTKDMGGATPSWYVVNGNVVNDNRLVVWGVVNIILTDGSSLTLEEGISVQSDRTLNIYAQSEGDSAGALICYADTNDNAAIGSDETSGDCGTINIHGGKVTADTKNNGEDAAGIGGGEEGNGGNVTIYGGVVKATGGSVNDEGGAGIGGGDRDGDRGGNGGTTIIYGGDVTAQGGANAAGIGGGDDGGNCGTVKIYGGTVKATGGSVNSRGGAGIGGGGIGGGGWIEIHGGDVTAQGGANAAGIGGGDEGSGGEITITGGTVNATGGSEYSDGGAGIGGGNEKDGGTIRITGGEVTSQGGCDAAGIGGGDYGEGGTITITGGTISATGGEYGAGIGGGQSKGGGTINITGGEITATGGEYGAGIGGGDEASGGTISISGGKVIATGGVGTESGAGIGSGRSTKGGGTDPMSITLSGDCDVTATGGNEAAGIGGGDRCWFGEVTIEGGTVVAQGGEGGPGIGNGYGYNSTFRRGDKGISVTITGGNVKATGGSNGAGIGGGHGSISGVIQIDGGTVEATGGDEGAAGIGTGSRCCDILDGGAASPVCVASVDITINGGSVIAKAGALNTKANVNYPGVAIGTSGSQQIAAVYRHTYFNGKIALNGGTITAYAAPVGGDNPGYPNHGMVIGTSNARNFENSAVGNVEFNGATVHMYPASGSDGVKSQTVLASSVSVNGQRVIHDGITATKDNRVSTLTSTGKNYVLVEPCTHAEATLVNKGDTHTGTCSHCEFSGEEPHRYGAPTEWTWNDDNTAAMAVFQCACGHKVSVGAEVTLKEGDDTKYVATATLDGKTYTAEADRLVYDITVEDNEHGSIEVNSTARVGSEVGLDVVPDEHYHLKSVAGDGVTLNHVEGNHYTFTMPKGNVTLRAEFVNKVAVESVSLNKDATTLAIDGTEILVATVLPEETDSTVVDKTVTWKSSGESVATVDKTGKVTAVAPGTATITVTATNGTADTADDKTATCIVTVNKEMITLTLIGSSIDGEDAFAPYEVSIPKGSSVEDLDNDIYDDIFAHFTGGVYVPYYDDVYVISQPLSNFDNWRDVEDDVYYSKALTENTTLYVPLEKEINSIELSVEVPVCGTDIATSKPAVAMAEGSLVKVSPRGPIWVDAETIEEIGSGTIEGGTTYGVEVEFVVDEFGYFLTDNTDYEISVAGADEGSVVKASYGVYFTVTAEHDWGEWTQTEAPTCSKVGKEERVCSGDASHTETRDVAIDSDAHDWGEWEVVKEATETEKGSEQRVCKNDGTHIDTREIPVIGHVHNLVKKDAKEAACTEDGNIEYWVCEGADDSCGRYFSDAEGENEIDQEGTVVKAQGHKPADPVRENEKAATCEEAGSYDEVVYCAVCSAELSRKTKSIEALGHDWGEPSYEWAADNSKVTAKHRCTVCKMRESEKVYTTSEITKEPTCSEEGERTYVSDRFEAPEFEVQTKTGVKIPADADKHDWGEWTKLDDKQHQRVCGHNAAHVEKANHTWDAGKVTKEATTTSEGEKTYTCTVCKGTKTETIPRLDPTPTPVPSAATMPATSVTVNNATASADAIRQAIQAAGGNADTLVLGKNVKRISKRAFAGTGIKTIVVESKKLKKKTVKGSLKGSSVTTVKVKVGKAKTNKKYVKKYKKIFTKKNAGKKVKVKR
jgi:hypothetical protein